MAPSIFEENVFSIANDLNLFTICKTYLDLYILRYSARTIAPNIVMNPIYITKKDALLASFTLLIGVDIQSPPAKDIYLLLHFDLDRFHLHQLNEYFHQSHIDFYLNLKPKLQYQQHPQNN